MKKTSCKMKKYILNYWHRKIWLSLLINSQSNNLQMYTFITIYFSVFHIISYLWVQSKILYVILTFRNSPKNRFICFEKYGNCYRSLCDEAFSWDAIQLHKSFIKFLTKKNEKSNILWQKDMGELGKCMKVK